MFSRVKFSVSILRTTSLLTLAYLFKKARDDPLEMKLEGNKGRQMHYRVKLEGNKGRQMHYRVYLNLFVRRALGFPGASEVWSISLVLSSMYSAVS